jgi:hypothetical protein
MLLKKTVRIIFGIILIGLGFAAGTISTNCSQGASGKKYEYKIFDLAAYSHPNAKVLGPAFNKMGSEGWEYSGTVVLGTLAVFKR